MSELKSGYVAELTVQGMEGSRWILVDENEATVLVNASEIEGTLTAGQTVHTFLYTNRRGELVGSMNIPRVTCTTYGWARVIRVDHDEGVYVDIGASFEVLVDKGDLPRIKALWPQLNDALYMTLRTDLGGTIFGRLITEQRAQELLTKAPTTIFNKNIKARPYRLLPVGSFLLSTNENYRIFVHHTEQENEPRLGEEVLVRIIDVKDDGTLNGSLLPRKEERITDDAQHILRYLQDVGGKMPFTDKSSPEEIQEMFQMSKGAFKRALGTLMKQGKIVQLEGWTTLK